MTTINYNFMKITFKTLHNWNIRFTPALNENVKLILNAYNIILL